jgi:hypothetical protein
VLVSTSIKPNVQAQNTISIFLYGMRVDFLGGENAAFAILLKIETVKKLKKKESKT